jgi:hypothetical protein
MYTARTGFYFAAICFLCITLIVTPITAEDSRPADFYKDNFAINPFDNNKNAQSTVAGSKGSSTQQNSSKAKQFPGLAENNPQPQAGATKSSLEGFDVQSVISIGAVINALDKEHLGIYTKKLSDLLVERNIPAGQFYMRHLVGTLPDLQSFMRLIVYGATPRYISTLPEKYAMLTASPTWIIQTEKGEYLLEGVEALERFITADGGFVEKPIAAPAMEEAKPTPTPLRPAAF